MKKIKDLSPEALDKFSSKVNEQVPSTIDKAALEDFNSELERYEPEDADGLGDLNEYRKQACNAIGIPYELKEGKIYHHIGDIEVSSSIAAMNALVAVYHKQKTPHNYIFSYEYYLDACKRVERIRRQLEQIEDYYRKGDYEKLMPREVNAVDDQFIQSYDLATYTPDSQGFCHYIRDVARDLYKIIKEPIPLRLEEDPGRPHGYVLGTPGSGKSELLKLLVHTYVTNQKYGSVVVIDPTSEFVNQIARWKEFNTSDRLIYIRPSLAKGMTPVINPFQIYGVEATDYREEALNVKRVVAQELVSALGRIVSETGSRLSGPMTTVLTNCILVLLDKEGADLRDLARFMKDDSELISFACSLSHHEYLAEYFRSDGGGFNTKGNYQTKEAVARRLDELLSIGTFNKLTCGQSTFQLEEAVNQRKVILFDLGKGSMGAREGSAFGRLVIATLLGMAYRRERIPKNQRVPCSLIVDECQNFLSESIEDILAEARKYRLFVTLAQQTAGQRMPIELKDAVLQYTNMQIVGGTTPSGAKRNADLVGVTPEDITKLSIGEFYTRPTRSAEAIMFKTRTDLLEWKNTVTSQTWKRIVNDQVRQYYRHYGGGKKVIVEVEPDINPQDW